MNTSLSTVERVSFAARRLIQFESRFAKWEIQAQGQLADTMQALAAAIWGLRENLLQGRPPIDAARELAYFANILAEQLRPFMESEERERLIAFFHSACNTMLLFREFHDIAHKDRFSEELEKASILLQALANGLQRPTTPDSLHQAA